MYQPLSPTSPWSVSEANFQQRVFFVAFRDAINQQHHHCRWYQPFKGCSYQGISHQPWEDFRLLRMLDFRIFARQKVVLGNCFFIIQERKNTWDSGRDSADSFYDIIEISKSKLDQPVKVGKKKNYAFRDRALHPVTTKICNRLIVHNVAF